MKDEKENIVKTAVIVMTAILVLMSMLPAMVSAQSDVKINEIMYDPSTEQGNDNKMEWIELYNSDTEAINISGWTLNGREILDTIMQPEDYVVLAWNKTAVEAYYGDALTCPVIDITLQLVNKPGDTIVLSNSTGAEIDNVTYNASWGADGNGKTLERTATGTWAESIVDGGTPCKLNSVAIVIPFSSWGPPVIYTSNITVDTMNPENVGKNATTRLFTTIEKIDNVSYYVVSISKPTDITKMYISMDDMNEDYLMKRAVTEAAPGLEPVNLTFDPAFVMWDFPLEAGKTWTTTSNVTGNLPVSEAPVNSTAVVPSKVTAEEVTVPLGTFPCLVVENNISYEVAGIPISILEKHWISPTYNGFMCPKSRSYVNGRLVEELELIAVAFIPPTFLNASDNNTAINVTTARFLVITLDEVGGAGYSWEVTEPLDELVLRQIGGIVDVPFDIFGGTLKQVATFEVVGVGNTTIKMVNRRPGETDVEPVDTFTLNVTAN